MSKTNGATEKKKVSRLDTFDTPTGGEEMAMKRDKTIQIAAPKFERIEVTIKGTSQYVQNKFSAKAMNAMVEKQEAGSQAKKGKQRDAKDFDACYEAAKHVAVEGWCGIPAPALRNAMIAACGIVGFKMTWAKKTLFVEAGGVDRDDGTPLVRITKGEPHCVKSSVRNASGVFDIRPRPTWDAGWEAVVTVRYDADMFERADVCNLLARAGMQVGIGEGRPDSRRSAGLGWGLFELK